MPRCVISWADVPTPLLTLLRPGWFAPCPHGAYGDSGYPPGAGLTIKP
jgi:hypothetical protein